MKVNRQHEEGNLYQNKKNDGYEMTPKLHYFLAIYLQIQSDFTNAIAILIIILIIGFSSDSIRS